MTRRKRDSREERRESRSLLKKARDRVKNNRDLLDAYAVFIGFSVFACFAVQTTWISEYLLIPLNEVTAAGTAWIMRLLGSDSSHLGSQIVSGAGSVNIAEGCNSVYATIIFISGILAFPTSWGKKAVGVVAGTVALFLLNFVRVVTLVYLSGFDSWLFDGAHLYIWQFAIILIGGLLWLLWYDKIVAHRPAKA